MANDSFQQQIFNMIQSLSGEKNLLAIPREIIRFTGDLESGVFLAQLIYWTDKGSRKDGFIYKTIREWQDEVFISEYSLRKIRKNLEGMGILETKLKKANGNPTIHYRINQKAFIDQFLCFQRKETSITNKEDFVSEDSLTYTTPQTINTKYNYMGARTCSSLTFTEYVNLHSVDKDKIESIEYYLKRYKQHANKSLPKHKEEKWDYIISDWFKIYDSEMPSKGTDADTENMKVIIDSHFKTTYTKGNYSIIHFLSGNIKAHRYYENFGAF